MVGLCSSLVCRRSKCHFASLCSCSTSWSGVLWEPSASQPVYLTLAIFCVDLGFNALKSLNSSLTFTDRQAAGYILDITLDIVPELFLLDLLRCSLGTTNVTPEIMKALPIQPLLLAGVAFSLVRASRADSQATSIDLGGAIMAYWQGKDVVQTSSVHIASTTLISAPASASTIVITVPSSSHYD